MVAIALARVSGLSFVLSLMLTNGREDFLGIEAFNEFSSQFAFFSSLTRAWEFAVGGMLVLASRRLSTLARGSEWVLVILGVGLVGYSAVRFDAITLLGCLNEPVDELSMSSADVNPATATQGGRSDNGSGSADNAPGRSGARPCPSMTRYITLMLCQPTLVPAGFVASRL